MEWVEIYSLGIVNNDVPRPDSEDDLASALSSLHISMSCPQMRSNLIGYAAIATYLAYQYPIRPEIYKRVEFFRGN
jgi:hypothetical protein